MATCPSCGEDNAQKAKFCSECGTPLGVRGDRAERKLVTALFCDVVGSTSLGETHDPEVLKPALRAYFDDARAAVERHGGRVEKYIGDAVAAVFGVPIAHEDDALRAVRAAAEIQARMRDRAADASIPIECRIGVDSGEVLASGDDTPLVGDAMNTAARLQSEAPPGGIVIGDPTYLLVRDAVVADPLGPLVAKGKAEPVVAYLVREVREGVAGVTRHLESPLVGRIREQRLLGDALEQALADRSVHLFTLVGAPGIGKTRLVEEFMRSAANDAVVVRGRCLAYGDGITFWPIAEIVRGAAGVMETDSLDLAREKIGKLLPDTPDRPSIVERVTELLGMGATPNAEETFWAVRKVLEAMAAERPLVCVIEDLHWAEPGLLDLIDHVTDWSREARILLLCNARPEFLERRPGWAGGKLNATTVALQPLSVEEIDELIANLLGGTDLDATIVARIGEAAEGNPLFVEQLLAMLADQGVLRSEGGRWTTSGEVTLVVVPPSIRALLGARLDALGDVERRLLEAAAVEGRTFHVGTVAALTDLSRPEVETALMGMARKELLRPDRAQLEGEDAFRFRHILIADVAYDAIPKRRRAELHERFASDLEERVGERVPEYQEILGHHLERAFRLREELGLHDQTGLAARAADHLASAGHRALARGDAAATAALLGRAMELRPVGPDRYALVPDLVLALVEGARDRDAVRLLDAAIGAMPDTGAGLLPHRLRIDRILVGNELGEPLERDAVEQIDAAYAAALASEDDLLRSRALVARARVLEDLPPFDLLASKEALEESIDAAIRSGDPRARADAENWLGGIYCWGPFSIGEAVAFCDRVLFDGPRRDRLLLGYGLANGYARAAAFRGDFDEARDLLREAKEHFADLGATRGLLGTIAIGADVERLAGDLDAAGSVLRSALEGGSLDPDAVEWIALDLALQHAFAGDADEAQRWLDRGVAPASWGSGLIVGAVRLRILLARRQIADALILAREGVADRAHAGYLDVWCEFLEAAADVFEAAGEGEEFRATLDDLADAYRRKGNLVALRRTEERISAFG
jgi:class 3 adenylate cyclase/tetratricopeptide (TPR) repeat protein